MANEKNTPATNVQTTEGKNNAGAGRTGQPQEETLAQAGSGSIDQDEGNMDHGETGNNATSGGQES